MTDEQRRQWKLVARRLVRESREWEEANPGQREKQPPRFKHKLTDDVKPLEAP